MRLLAFALLAAAAVSGREIKKICEPGTMSKEYCNDCRCSADGTFRDCTIMACDENVYNQDGSLKTPGGVPENALLRHKRQLSEGATCEPGKTFKDYCNTCTCGRDGVTMACTMMACDKRIYNKDGTLKNVEQATNNALLRQKRQLGEAATCEPGKTFKDYCNTCTCGRDGVTRVCTMMACDDRIYNKDGTLKNVEQAPNNALLRQKRQLSEGATCEPGKTFKDYCNTCTCGRDGVTMACTMMACDKSIYNKDGTLKNVEQAPNNALLRQKRQLSEGATCEPGKTFKDYCNTCTCGRDGRTRVCTMMACDERIYNKDGSLKNVERAPNNALLRQKRQPSEGKTCEPGKTFKDYCNTCACGPDGIPTTCTRMACPKGMFNADGSLKNVETAPNNALLRQKRQLGEGTTCVPGETFMDYCNTCTCGRDGVTKVCSLMACNERIWNKDGSRKDVEQTPNNALLRQKRQLSEGATCEPGKTFKDYCNTCTCGRDGVTRVCTMMACDERIYNKDGSLKNIDGAPNNALLRQKRQPSEGKTCEPGKTFKDYCNTCACGPDGIPTTCTRMACPKGMFNADGSLKNVETAPNNALLRQKRQLSEGATCEPGKTFKDYCNTCTCGRDGRTRVCTMMACDERIYNKDGSLKNIDGAPNNALLRQKRQLSEGATCEPGKTFKDYCNTCTCGRDGRTRVCTMMACDERIYNKDGSLKNIDGAPNNALLRQKRQPSEGKTCEPGKIFNDYCNTCACGPDGIPTTCTRMACPKGVFNVDGSLKNVETAPNNALLRQKRQYEKRA